MAKLTYRQDSNSWDLERGEFTYRRDDQGHAHWLIFWPVDCPAPMKIPLAPQRNSVNATWQLSGTEERPTLTPSVHWVGVWHGWLRDGETTLA